MSDLLKYGSLDRRGLVLGRWATRFYILRDTFIFVIKSQPNTIDAIEEALAHPDYVIPLNSTGCDCRESPSTKNHPFVFTISIKQPKEEHILNAPSAEERTEWIEAINNSIKLVSNDTITAEPSTTTNYSHSHHGSYSASHTRNSSHSNSRSSSPSRTSITQRPPPMTRAASTSQHSQFNVSQSTIIESPDNHPAQTLPVKSILLDDTENQFGRFPADDSMSKSALLKHSASTPEQLKQQSGLVQPIAVHTTNGIASQLSIDPSMTGTSTPHSPSPTMDQTNHDPARGVPHRRTNSHQVFPTSPRSPRSHVTSVSVSAVDDETRLKLKQIEESSNDPELLAMQAEGQLLMEKVNKLKLHKKVLTTELKSLLPRLQIQTKVNAGFQEEIQFHKQLKQQRVTHRIQLCNWAQQIKQRLINSEPAGILKQQRRAYQQQSPIQPTNGHLQYGLPSSSTYNSPITPRSVSISGNSFGTPTSLPSSPYMATSPYGLSPSSKVVHSELIRLSNVELDLIESELKSRLPPDGPSSGMLSALEKEEAMYTSVDASLPPPDLASLTARRPSAAEEEWSRQKGSTRQQNGTTPPGQTNGTTESGHDPRYLLLRSHTSSMNDFSHVLIHLLLREVAIRRQLNLLQTSIYKLTSEKELSFRTKHALAAAASAKGSKSAAKEKKSKSKKTVTMSTSIN